MKKTLTLFVCIFLFISCESPYIFNRVITQSDGTKYLYGGVDRFSFEKEPFSTWYLSEYESYNPNPETIKKLKKKLKKYRIEVFMGTWDSESKVIYPRLRKILDEAKFHDRRVTTYAVNEYKKSFYGEGEGKDIQYLPTIIFYRGGKEYARIVEKPVGDNLEQDILMIVNELDYQPAHSEE